MWIKHGHNKSSNTKSYGYIQTFLPKTIADRKGAIKPYTTQILARNPLQAPFFWGQPPICDRITPCSTNASFCVHTRYPTLLT